MHWIATRRGCVCESSCLLTALAGEQTGLSLPGSRVSLMAQMTPEEQARQRIDAVLAVSDWVVPEHRRDVDDDLSRYLPNADYAEASGRGLGGGPSFHHGAAHLHRPTHYCSRKHGEAASEQTC